MVWIMVNGLYHWATYMCKCLPCHFHLCGSFVQVHCFNCIYFRGWELSAKQVAQIYFYSVVRQFGLTDNVVHDRDPRFTAEFWTELWNTLGSRAVFSSAYHPKQLGKQKDRTEY